MYGISLKIDNAKHHIIFKINNSTGVYISRTTYVRPGEQNLDSYYRPFHLVEYYRYMRFLSDGTVVVHTSADEPATAIPRLKIKHGGGNSSVSVGHYRVSGDKVHVW